MSKTARTMQAEALWSIEELRRQIDAADAVLLRALAERMSLVRQIGRHKKTASMTTVQIGRWTQLLAQRLALGSHLGLSPDFVLALFEQIHLEAIRVQDDLVEQTTERAAQS